MRVTMVSGAVPNVGMRIVAYINEILTGQVAVPVAPALPLNILTPVSGFSYLVTLRNVSPAAQTIRFGAAPDFIALTGTLLRVNDVVTFDFFGSTIDVIGSAAGALLEVGIWST